VPPFANVLTDIPEARRAAVRAIRRASLLALSFALAGAVWSGGCGGAGGAGQGSGGATSNTGGTSASTGGAPASTGGAPAGSGGSGGVTGTGGGSGGAGTGGLAGTGGRAGSGGVTPGTGGAGATATGGVAGAASGGAGGRPGAGGGPGSGGRAGAVGQGGAGATAGQAGATGGAGGSLAGTNNPVLPGLTADPQIAEFDGVFYIYPTSDGFASWASTSFRVYSSTNLVQWTDRGVVLDLAKDLTWATQYAWAPAIARVNGTFFFYFCAAQQLGVATSTSPTGPFKDALGHALVTTRQYGPQSIDPYLFTDDDGTHLLYFGSGTGGLRVVKLNADMISFTGTPTDISPSGASGVLEGSGMFKRSGSYYLYWSEGDTRTATYQMAYARASSPTGPFKRSGVILQQDTAQGILGPGGGTVLAIPARDEYDLVYHRFKIPGGDGTHREVCIDPMTFASDGTIAPVKPTLKGLQAPVSP